MTVQIQVFNLRELREDIRLALWKIKVYDFKVYLVMTSQSAPHHDDAAIEYMSATIQFPKHKYPEGIEREKKWCDSCYKDPLLPAKLHYRKVKGFEKDKNRKKYRCLCRWCWELAYEGSI